MHRAREFNLDEQRLREGFLEPWLAEQRIELGDRTWSPRDSELLVLEGRELAMSELGSGQGWANAERSAEDVTKQVLATQGEAAGELVAVLAETLTAQLSVGSMLERLGHKAVEWPQARTELVEAARARRPANPGVALLVVEQMPPSGTWLFEAGLAIGALGGRIIVAQFGTEDPPPELARFEVIRLGPDEGAAAAAIGERLEALQDPRSPA